MPRSCLLFALVTTACMLLGAAEPPARPERNSPAIPLSTKLRFVVRPTLLGLVPPDDPEDYGEILVRVIALNGDALGLRYEIKERVRKEVPLAGLPAAAPAGSARRPSLLPERSRPRPAEPKPAEVLTKQVDATRIRRGLINAAREAAVHRLDAPLYWDDGDWQTGSGALWLSGEAYRELSTGGSTAWEVQPAAWNTSPAADELARAAAARRSALGLAADAPLRLELADANARYPVIVNGERADLPALLARDSLGLAKYWILADEHNPLVLKLTYMPLETASAVAPPVDTANGVDNPAEEAAPDTAAATPAGPETTPAADADTAAPDTAAAAAAPADPRRKRNLLPDRGGAHSAGAAPAANGVNGAQAPAGLQARPDLISAGAGFAIIEINF